MRTLIKPILTEKAEDLKEKRNVYVFQVDKSVNKIEVAKTIAAKYSVRVLGVRTIMYRGKSTARYTKTGVIKGNKSNFKKAYVTVHPEDEIDFYEHV